MASRPELLRPSQEFPARHDERVRTANQPRSTGFRAGAKSRGVTQPVPYVYLPVSLTAPGPSGSPEPTRLRRGCSHPPRRPPDQAASSFTSPLRRQRNGRSLTSIRKISSASWRTSSSCARSPGRAARARRCCCPGEARDTRGGEPARPIPGPGWRAPSPRPGAGRAARLGGSSLYQVGLVRRGGLTGGRSFR